MIEAARVALDRPGISVVEAALLAKRLGATALHDPTEGGLAGGLHEIACAAGVRIRVDRDAILWFEPGLVVCRALDADPWSTLASGSLLAVFPATVAEAALAELAGHQHTAAAVGVVEPGSGVHDIVGAAIPWPDRDEVARLLASSDELIGLDVDRLARRSSQEVLDEPGTRQVGDLLERTLPPRRGEWHRERRPACARSAAPRARVD